MTRQQKSFAFTLLVGIVAGTWSTVFGAAPVAALLACAPATARDPQPPPRVPGIDVSRFQEDIAWDAVALDGMLGAQPFASAPGVTTVVYVERGARAWHGGDRQVVVRVRVQVQQGRVGDRRGDDRAAGGLPGGVVVCLCSKIASTWRCCFSKASATRFLSFSLSLSCKKLTRGIIPSDCKWTLYMRIVSFPLTISA